MEEYFDKYGLLRMNKDIPVENGILFTAYHALFGGQATGHYTCAHLFSESPKEGYYRANPPEDTDHFSHDNMKGKYFLMYMTLPYASEEIRMKAIRRMPSFYWNGSMNWHPNSWMVLLAVKHRFFNAIFKPAIWAMIWYSFKFSKKSDTSGKNLWFLCDKMLGYDYPFDRDEVKDNFLYYITNGNRWENFDNPLYKLVLKY